MIHIRAAVPQPGGGVPPAGRQLDGGDHQLRLRHDDGARRAPARMGPVQQPERGPGQAAGLAVRRATHGGVAGEQSQCPGRVGGVQRILGDLQPGRHRFLPAPWGRAPPCPPAAPRGLQQPYAGMQAERRAGGFTAGLAQLERRAVSAG